MRRLLTGVLIAGVLALSSGCQVVNGPSGRMLKPVAWHLRDGSYRPFNDVNSGSLLSWNREFGAYDSYAPGWGWWGGGSPNQAYNSYFGGRPLPRN